MKLLRIGITHGDINGVGYEMLLKVFQDPEMLDVCTPIIFGNAQVAAATARQIELEPIPFNVIARADDAIEGRVNLVSVCKEANPELQFGQQTEAALQAEAKSLTAAIEAYRHHQIDALVTLPGHLDNDADSHALSDYIRRALGSEEESFDWIINGQVRALLLRSMDASTELGEGLASETLQVQIKTISQCLRQDFCLIKPRIALVSNQGKTKHDIDDLREDGILIFGPFEAGTFSEDARQYHYDGCLFLGEEDACQEIISQEEPDHAIGYVSGLPIVLTYPIHGIDYQHAGQGVTCEISLRQAIYAAIDIMRNRQRYRYATHNPLEKQWVPRGRDDFKLDLTKEE